jgi:hypothetical protein
MYIKNPPYVDKNRDEVRATIAENIVAIKELLVHNQSPAALETTVKLVTKALVQQEKATSSRRLESDPALCLSMDFVSQEHRVPRDGPKDSNAGG